MLQNPLTNCYSEKFLGLCTDYLFYLLVWEFPSWSAFSCMVLFFHLPISVCLLIWTSGDISLLTFRFQDERGMMMNTSAPVQNNTFSVDAFWALPAHQRRTFNGGNDAEEVNECGFNSTENQMVDTQPEGSWEAFPFYHFSWHIVQAIFLTYHRVLYLYIESTACGTIYAEPQN